MELQEDISTQRLERRIGREIEVLVDDIDEEGAIARSRATRRRSTAWSYIPTANTSKSANSPACASPTATCTTSTETFPRPSSADFQALARHRRCAARADAGGRHGAASHRLARPLHRPARCVVQAGQRPRRSPRWSRLCAEGRIPMVPQGGNTGLCGGATPMHDGEVVIVLSRLQPHPRDRPDNNTITVEAGCLLAEVQAAARRRPPVPALAGGRGQLQIGGNLSTNAGGVQVLRYGNTRELTLGLEAVLPDGASGTACAACARTTPATTSSTSSSAPRARWASSPPPC
jgi:hypothetical protein